MAYIEGTLGARVANEALAGIIGPMGCIQQGSGLTHSGGDDPITVNASAMPAGLTAGTAEICNQVEGPGLWKIIKGRMVVSLVKLRSPGNSSTPDDYYTCRNIFYNQRSWSTRLNMQPTLSTPPCGAGYSAVLSCLQAPDLAPAPGDAMKRPADLTEDDSREALEAEGYRVAAAAERLGISRMSLYGIIERSEGLRTARDIPRIEILEARERHAGDPARMAAALQVSERALKLRMAELDITAGG